VAEMEEQREQAAQDAASMPDLTAQEQSYMQSLITSHSLREESIRPDGNCLYAAFASQVNSLRSSKVIFLRLLTDTRWITEPYVPRPRNSFAVIDTISNHFSLQTNILRRKTSRVTVKRSNKPRCGEERWKLLPSHERWELLWRFIPIGRKHLLSSNLQIGVEMERL
jgi:hypothetical protein